MSFEESVDDGQTDNEHKALTIAHLEHPVLRWANKSENLHKDIN